MSPPEHSCPQHAASAVVGTCDRCGRFYCSQCFIDAGAALPERSSRCPECPAVLLEKSIGGWLTLPALHLIVTPFLCGRAVFVDARALIGGVGPDFMPILVVELVSQLAWATVGLLAAWAFFRRKRSAVRWMLAFYVGLVVISLINEGLANRLREIAHDSSAVPASQSLQAVLGAAIWLAYFSQSVRVKRTFVVP